MIRLQLMVYKFLSVSVAALSAAVQSIDWVGLCGWLFSKLLYGVNKIVHVLSLVPTMKASSLCVILTMFHWLMKYNVNKELFLEQKYFFWTYKKMYEKILYLLGFVQKMLQLSLMQKVLTFFTVILDFLLARSIVQFVITVLCLCVYYISFAMSFFMSISYHYPEDSKKLNQISTKNPWFEVSLLLFSMKVMSVRLTYNNTFSEYYYSFMVLDKSVTVSMKFISKFILSTTLAVIVTKFAQGQPVCFLDMSGLYSPYDDQMRRYWFENEFAAKMSNYYMSTTQKPEYFYNYKRFCKPKMDDESEKWLNWLLFTKSDDYKIWLVPEHEAKTEKEFMQYRLVNVALFLFCIVTYFCMMQWSYQIDWGGFGNWLNKDSGDEG